MEEIIKEESKYSLDLKILINKMQMLSFKAMNILIILDILLIKYIEMANMI